MKKILTVVCAVAMMFSLSVFAGAEENNVIAITTACKWPSEMASRVIISGQARP